MATITLNDALPIVRDLEAKLIPLGAHCALGGSVLHHGESNKDLDIFVYPHNQDETKTPEELIAILKSIFPQGWGATDDNYPHDRLRFVYMRPNSEGQWWKVEMFVFLTLPPR